MYAFLSKLHGHNIDSWCNAIILDNKHISLKYPKSYIHLNVTEQLGMDQLICVIIFDIVIMPLKYHFLQTESISIIAGLFRISQIRFLKFLKRNIHNCFTCMVNKVC